EHLFQTNVRHVSRRSATLRRRWAPSTWWHQTPMPTLSDPDGYLLHGGRRLRFERAWRAGEGQAVGGSVGTSTGAGSGRRPTPPFYRLVGPGGRALSRGTAAPPRPAA